MRGKKNLTRIGILPGERGKEEQGNSGYERMIIIITITSNLLGRAVT